MKKLTQTNRGITLIALVITIIVLLILAAVTIATLTGENGILTKASSAAEAQKKAEVKEKVQVEVLASYDNNGKLNMETLKANLKSHLGVNDITTNDDGSISFILDGYNVTVTKEGIVTVGDEAEKEEEEPSIIQAESITVDDLTIAPGEQQKLNVTTNPEYITEELEYTSEDQNKATVETDGTITGVEEGTTTITVKGKTSGQSGQCTVTVMKKLASQITASNYGDPVAYDVDLDGDTGTNDWKIFYKDEDNNVFLIAAEYLDYEKNKDKIKWDDTKLKKAYEDHEGAKYSLNWSEDNPPEVKSEGIDANLFEANLFKLAMDDNDYNTGEKCVSALLNTNYWENFVNPSYKGHAKAIGSPTLEMWIKSWNAKGYEQLTINDREGGNPATVNGTSNLELVDKLGYNDKLYFPHSEGVNILDDIGCNETGPEAFAYWLASSLDDGSGYWGADYLSCVRSNGVLMHETYKGGIGCYLACDDQYAALRPVVSLDSSIKGNQEESGIWKLAK